MTLHKSNYKSTHFSLQLLFASYLIAQTIFIIGLNSLDTQPAPLLTPEHYQKWTNTISVHTTQLAE